MEIINNQKDDIWASKFKSLFIKQKLIFDKTLNINYYNYTVPTIGKCLFEITILIRNKNCGFFEWFKPVQIYFYAFNNNAYIYLVGNYSDSDKQIAIDFIQSLENTYIATHNSNYNFKLEFC